MTILFGHPTGNPNSHHAALSHFESGWLEAFCVPWMPTTAELSMAALIPGAANPVARLSRRSFAPLVDAPRIEGRLGEWCRLARRVLRPSHAADDRLSDEANDWLMHVMRRACERAAVTAVHSYEDCSLLQFEAAKRLGKACIYDLPIGYHAAWERIEADLIRKYCDWLPAGGVRGTGRIQRKQREMALADLVLVPSRFVESSVRASHAEKACARAPYGVDLDYWQRNASRRTPETLRFLYAGQLSLRKGTPLLLEAWKKAALRHAELHLVGAWQLSEGKRSLPPGATWSGPCSRAALRDRLQSADVFVFPSFFEGLALVVLEALACGLPVIATDVTDLDVVPPDSGRVVPAGHVDALVEALRWFNDNRESWAAMSAAARKSAERYSWENYRARVREVTAPFIR